MVLADVVMTSFWVQLQLELPLRHGGLDPLAVARVGGGSVARIPNNSNLKPTNIAKHSTMVIIMNTRKDIYGSETV